MPAARRVRQARRWVTALLGIAIVAGSARVNAAEERKPLVQGEPPPDFTLPDTRGRQVRLSDFKGRAILLTFVSCYTDTCLAPVNAFEALLAKFGPARFAAPTVCSEIPAALKQDGYAGLLQRCSAGQTILIDEEQAAATRYFVTEFPTSLLIGPDFTLREVLAGVPALRDPALPGRIEALANQVAAPVPSP